MIAISLALGKADYLYFFPKLDWADAFVNAPMILWGMGPMAVPESTGARLFSGCYAIYSDLMLVMSAGVVFASVAHRFLHKLHADEDDNRERAKHDPTKKN